MRVHSPSKELQLSIHQKLLTQKLLFFLSKILRRKTIFFSQLLFFAQSDLTTSRWRKTQENPSILTMVVVLISQHLISTRASFFFSFVCSFVPHKIKLNIAGVRSKLINSLVIKTYIMSVREMCAYYELPHMCLLE